MKKNIIVLIATAAVCVSVLPASFAVARHATKVPDLVTINNAENAYFNSHGSYFQVLINNQLPSHQTGTLADYVDPQAVPLNTSIDVYVSPAGAGYAVRWTIPATTREEGSENSVGYGPEALSRTYTNIIPVISRATSTRHTIERGDRRQR